MEIGIAFPKTMPAGRSERILEWAQRADEGPFSSLAMIDRLVYGNHDVLITMTAAAAVTERIRLMPTVLVLPLRGAAVTAKQVASIDAISGGRFSLGLGVGSRPDDFAAAQVPMRARGRHFEEQITTMRRIWRGEAYSDEAGPIGPAPARKGGPELLIGGRSEAALRRSGRLGDGYISGSAGKGASNASAEVAGYYKVVEAAWKEAGRPGRPRLVTALTCALGPYAAARTAESIRSYYSFRGDAATMEVPMPTTDEELLEAIHHYEAIGADELILEPGCADLDQVDRLADVAADYLAEA